jgi:single-strand DNA-binding protein
MARGFNKAIIIGNLAKDPEIRYTASGTATARLVVAVNRTWTKNGEKHEECDFIPAVVWDKMAENCDRYLRKGSALLVEGRISVRSYEGRDGQKKYTTEIVAQTVQFLGSGKKSEKSLPEGYEKGYAEGSDKAFGEGLPKGFQEGSQKSFSDSPEEDEDIPF